MWSVHRDGKGGRSEMRRVESSGGRTNEHAADEKRMSSRRRRKLLRLAVSGEVDWAPPRRLQNGTRSNRLSTRSTAPRSASKNCRVVRKTLVVFYCKSFSRHSNRVDVTCAKISAKVIKIILRTVVTSFVFIFLSLYNDFVCGSR